MINPYGAVPEALRETRLTLRDIMADLLSTKVQESKHKLALAELDAEKKVMELQGEKMRLGAEIDLATVASEKDWREEKMGLETERLAETERHHIAMEETDAEKLRLAQGQERYLDEAKKPAEWAGTIGLSKTQKDIFLSYYPDDIPIKRREIMQAVANIRKNPVIHYKYSLLGTIDKLEDIQARLKDPKISPVETAELTTRYDAIYKKASQLKRLVDFIDKNKTKLKPEEMAEIKDDAMAHWETSDDEFKNQYDNNYRDFEKSYIDDYMDILKQSSINLEALKRKPGEKEEPGEKERTKLLSEKDEKWFADKINEVEKIKGKVAAQATFNAVKRFINQGNLDQAKRLIRIVLGEHREKKQKAPETKKSPLGEAGPSYKGSLSDVFGAMKNK